MERDRAIKVGGKQWEGSGTGRERDAVGGINHPTLKPSYATTLGYRGPTPLILHPHTEQYQTKKG